MLRGTCARRVWLGGAASTPSLGLDLRPSAGQFVNVIPEGTHHRRTSAHFNPTPGPGAGVPALIHPEIRHAPGRIAQAKPQMARWNRVLRADIYDELLKLPLRYALHDFDTLQRHLHRRRSDGSTRSVASQAHSREEIRGSSPLEGEETLQPTSLAALCDTYHVSGRDSSVGYAPPIGPADPLDIIPFFVHRTSNGRLPGKILSMHAKNLMPAFFLRIQGIDGDIFRFEEELMKIFPTKKIFVRSHSVYVYNVNTDGRAILHHWLLGLGF